MHLQQFNFLYRAKKQHANDSEFQLIARPVARFLYSS